MILLALAKIVSHLEKLNIDTRRTAIFHYTLPTVNYLTSPEAKLSPTFLPSKFWKYSKTFHQRAENIQRLFRLQNCLSRKSSAPENIQRLFRLQNCLSRKSSMFQKYSKTFRPAPSSKSNQQQPPTAATSKSIQQQPSTAATSKNNQQQPSTAATSESNQQ